MQIKEVEEKTGLARSNIRFYEKEKLILPFRNEKNGYKEYSQEDINNIKKIAYLRTLGVSIEDIRGVISQKVSLYKIIAKQEKVLDSQITDLEHAREICKVMLQSKDISYDKLEIENYVKEPKKYWKSNQKSLKLDAAGFLFMWSGKIPWLIITLISLLAAVLSFSKLPDEIPIQWRNNEASTNVSKVFIFAYPAACVVFHFGLRPFIWRWLQIRVSCREVSISDAVADYLTNFVCFLALSVELFTVLFVCGMAESVTTLIFVNVVVFIGLLTAAGIKLQSKYK